MKKIISLIFAMQILTCLSAQTSYYYSSNAGDSVVISGDTVFYKIFNDDGLDSFDIGKGVFRHKKNGDLIMKERIPFEWESSTLTIAKQDSNKIAVKAFYRNGRINGFASLLLYRQGKIFMTACLNADGVYEFDEKTSASLDGKEVVIRIADLGYDARHKLVLKKGTIYTVKFLYSHNCYITNDAKVKITYNKDGSINFFRSKNKRSAMSLKENKLDPTVAF